MTPVRTTLKILGTSLLVLVLVLAHGWAILALHFGIKNAALSAALLAVYGIAVIVFIVRFKRRRALVASLLLVVPVALWWNGIEASTGGRYPPETSVAARATFNGDG